MDNSDLHGMVGVMFSAQFGGGEEGGARAKSQESTSAGNELGRQSKTSQ